MIGIVLYDITPSVFNAFFENNIAGANSSTCCQNICIASRITHLFLVKHTVISLYSYINDCCQQHQ